MATRFTAGEKAQLQARFAEHSPKVWARFAEHSPKVWARFAEHSPKVWAHGDVATVHIFGGHYCIKKRESGYDWR